MENSAYLDPKSPEVAQIQNKRYDSDCRLQNSLGRRYQPMFERLMSLIKSMFDKEMAKLETPEVLAEQAEMELESNLKKITESLTSGIANEKLLEGKIKKSQEELSTWEKRAMIAVQQNNDDMAKQCLAKKQEFAAQTQSLETQLSDQKKTNAMMKDRHSEIQAKLREFKTKKTDMIARANASQAAAKASELVSGSGAGISSMEKFEQKIAEKEAMGQAMREVAGASKTEDDFNQWNKQAGLDNELLMLKATMANSGPKLIEAKEAPQKAMVDENVPMVIEDVTPREDQEKKD